MLCVVIYGRYLELWAFNHTQHTISVVIAQVISKFLLDTVQMISESDESPCEYMQEAVDVAAYSIRVCRPADSEVYLYATLCWLASVWLAAFRGKCSSMCSSSFIWHRLKPSHQIAKLHVLSVSGFKSLNPVHAMNHSEGNDVEVESMTHCTRILDHPTPGFANRCHVVQTWYTQKSIWWCLPRLINHYCCEQMQLWTQCFVNFLNIYQGFLALDTLVQISCKFLHMSNPHIKYKFHLNLIAILSSSWQSSFHVCRLAHLIPSFPMI